MISINFFGLSRYGFSYIGGISSFVGDFLRYSEGRLIIGLKVVRNCNVACTMHLY